MNKKDRFDEVADTAQKSVADFLAGQVGTDELVEFDFGWVALYAVNPFMFKKSKS